MKPVFLLAAFLMAISAPLCAQEAPQSKGQIAMSFAPVVRRVSPAVVNIYTRAMVRGGGNPLFNDPIFRQFFGNGFPEGFSAERMQSSLGSGVIIGAEGLVVTNNHLIDGAQHVTVALSDKREYEADVLSADPRSDLAILKLKTKGESFPTLALADSDDVQVGDLVLAIGNPFGVGQTVTMGIVSAVARSAAVRSGDVNYFIQTDAAINPGNSGGALISADGRLVGIPSAIYSRDGGSVGIGFAIPSNLVRAVKDSVGKEGKIVRGWSGIYGQTLTADLAHSLGLAHPGGVIVKSMHASSPAKAAGLQVGDVIRSLNGRAVDDEEAFEFRLATQPIGSQVVLNILRKGDERDISFVLSGAPESTPRQERLLQGRQPLSGAHVANLSPALAEELGLDDNAKGIIVLKVDGKSPAESLGVQRGDMVLAVNNRAVKTVEQLQNALAPSSTGWTITLARGGMAISLSVGP